MTLPKIEVPTYELTLPSTELKVKYRPFLVKEEKILIIALESQDTKQIKEKRGDVSSPSFLSVKKSLSPDLQDLQHLNQLQLCSHSCLKILKCCHP